MTFNLGIRLTRIKTVGNDKLKKTKNYFVS